MRIVVDLPAPFGPTNPATPPSGRSRSISLTARRSPKFLAKPAVRIEAMCLPSQLDLRATRCGGLWHRRCRRAGPGPGGAEDVGEEDHFDHDAEAVEEDPGLAEHVERRDGDVERCHDEVERAVRTGGQCHGEQDHEDRDPHEHERNDYEGLADVELEDDAGQDVVDGAGLVQVEVVDVDVEEHEAGPGCGELRSDRYRRIVQCCRGLGVCAQGSLHRVEGGCAWIGPHRPPFVRCTSTVYMRLIMHHLLCQAIPSGSLLVRPYPYIRGRYMGDKYHVLHRHLSRLSRLASKSMRTMIWG